ncbi:inositol monophosphatase family protein [Carboxylicivirga sp. M1479]|uniref:inositol monophosphatase family protein n=1 Tax=Carboxylicivirga sp. M1479 TaxID=2594476 RepID=UPI001178ADD4|nr:inositol monophosphatase family protein [Carboxylicivirga sp. M1479]TRX65770.1 inositol monophosphatase [Carboxylicivirga sp. M1479]
MNYEAICRQVCEVAIQTGQFISEERANNRVDVEVKGSNDFVTQVDKGAEKRIVDALSELLPESGFIAEEGTSNKKGKVYNWIIDPIDGTTNFIHGLAPYAISIALQENDDLVLGVIYEVGLKECFSAFKGSPVFLNGKKVNVSNTDTVKDSLIATGFPYSNYKRLDGFMNSVRYFMEHSRGLRRLGSAATDLAYVACGRFDSFYEYNLKPWDVAAGAFLVQQAGGCVCDFDGGNNYLFGQEIIATNKASFEEFTNVIKKIMD